MFERNFYMPIIAKIARDARIQERADNADELLYSLTNELDNDSINKSIALATELLYGAKASRPYLQSLISDLKKLATEHEQQELDLATGGVVKDNAVVVKGETTPINITKKKQPTCDISVCEKQIDTCCYYCDWHARCDEHCMMGSIGCQHKKISHTEEQPKTEGESGDGFAATIAKPIPNDKPFVLTSNGGGNNFVTMSKEKHDELHSFGHGKQSQILEMVSKALNTVKELRISREALHRFIEIDLDNIEKKFAEKNKRYGQDQDGFYNFTQGAKLHYGDASPNNTFRMLMAYTSKHIVALEQPDALTNDDEFDERCLDVAVYMMIARAMKKATREGAEK